MDHHQIPLNKLNHTPFDLPSGVVGIPLEAIALEENALGHAVNYGVLFSVFSVCRGLNMARRLDRRSSNPTPVMLPFEARPMALTGK